MKDIAGSPGTVGGLALRVAQFVFGVTSLIVMTSAYGFSNYTAFGYLAFQMALQSIWSFTLACVDIHALRNNWDLHNTSNAWKYLIGDWILAIGTLAAASSAGAVVIFMETDIKFFRTAPYLACSGYKVSAILASIAWSFLAASAGSMFCLLVSLYE